MTAIGTILDNKYEILTEIGRGGMSVVYLAMDRRLNKQWAVKQVKKQANDANNEIVVQSLLAEADMMKKLDHPLIPRIVDIIDDGLNIYIVMDYMTGQSLDKVVRAQGPLAERDVIHIGIQLCDALGYLHTRSTPIVYRDMKPANVMLKDPEAMAIELFDFGIAREYKEGKNGDTTLLGTPGFAAPEQCRRGKQTDARTDIYCLGATLYNLVTGHSPADDNKLYPIRHWNPRLSGGLEQIILKCTRAEPEDRYQDCAELRYALENYQLFDADFRKKQRRTLNLFLAPAILSVIFLAGGFVCKALYTHENTANYDTALAAAEKETDYTARQARYLEAIGYDASDVRAYEGLVNLYKQNDGVFDVEERAVLVQQLTQHQQLVREANGQLYIQLCYDVGTLYWFYFDYGDTGDNQTTRMTNALPWFTDVVDVSAELSYSFPKLAAAQIFCDIGEFYRDYANNVKEAADAGTYLEFWGTLEELRAYLETGSDQELMQWESYKVIVYALENLMSKFKSDGVSREQIEAMCDGVRSDAMSLAATTDTTAELRDYILSRLAEDGGIARGLVSNYGP